MAALIWQAGSDRAIGPLSTFSIAIRVPFANDFNGKFGNFNGLDCLRKALELCK